MIGKRSGSLSLILVATYAGWKGSLPAPLPEERLAASLRDALLPPSEFVPKYISGMFGDTAPGEVQEELANIMSGFHPIGFRLMSMTLATLDTRDLLPYIQTPTLLIWGEADKRSPINVAHQFRDAVPGAKLELIPKAGHMCNLEAPGQFNKIVSDFCLLLK